MDGVNAAVVQWLRSGAAAALMATALGCSGGGDRSAAGSTIPEPGQQPPAELLDLSHWALTLPVDAHGGTDGDAATVAVAQLLDDYSSPWCYGTIDDGVSFFAPVSGATTPNSPYPRSELRQMLDPEDASVNWTWDAATELSALVRVNQVPTANGKLVIGQIQGYNRDNPEISALARLVFEHNANGRATLYALVLPSPLAPGEQAQRLVIAEDLRLNEDFPYFIRVEHRTVTLGSGTRSVSAAIDARWQDVGLYFRAGVALQTAGSSADDGGRATFYDLRIEPAA